MADRPLQVGPRGGVYSVSATGAKTYAPEMRHHQAGEQLEFGHPSMYRTWSSARRSPQVRAEQNKAIRDAIRDVRVKSAGTPELGEWARSRQTVLGAPTGLARTFEPGRANPADHYVMGVNDRGVGKRGFVGAEAVASAHRLEAALEARQRAIRAPGPDVLAPSLGLRGATDLVHGPTAGHVEVTLQWVAPLLKKASTPQDILKAAAGLARDDPRRPMLRDLAEKAERLTKDARDLAKENVTTFEQATRVLYELDVNNSEGTSDEALRAIGVDPDTVPAPIRKMVLAGAKDVASDVFSSTSGPAVKASADDWLSSHPNMEADLVEHVLDTDAYTDKDFWLSQSAVSMPALYSDAEEIGMDLPSFDDGTGDYDHELRDEAKTIISGEYNRAQDKVRTAFEPPRRAWGKDWDYDSDNGLLSHMAMAASARANDTESTEDHIEAAEKHMRAARAYRALAEAATGQWTRTIAGWAGRHVRVASDAKEWAEEHERRASDHVGKAGTTLQWENEGASTSPLPESLGGKTMMDHLLDSGTWATYTPEDD